MQIAIEILTVTKSVGTSKTGKPYNIFEVAFKQDGQIKGKKLFEFKAKEVCKKLAGASTGDKFTIVQEKEGEYWEWKEIHSSGAADAGASSVSPTYASTPSVPKPASGGNWETKEERAYKQVLIVKQSSLSQAVSSLKTDKAAADPDAVIALAQKYTDWVLEQPKIKQEAAAAVKSDLSDMEDDVPF
jgi:hypothetical protein